MVLGGPSIIYNAVVQSLVEGEINVAQAAAFMVLLHAKVHTLTLDHQVYDDAFLHMLCIRRKVCAVTFNPQAVQTTSYARHPTHDILRTTSYAKHPDPKGVDDQNLAALIAVLSVVCPACTCQYAVVEGNLHATKHDIAVGSAERSCVVCNTG